MFGQRSRRDLPRSDCAAAKAVPKSGLKLSFIELLRNRCLANEMHLPGASTVRRNLPVPPRARQGLPADRTPSRPTLWRWRWRFHGPAATWPPASSRWSGRVRALYFARIDAFQPKRNAYGYHLREEALAAAASADEALAHHGTTWISSTVCRSMSRRAWVPRDSPVPGASLI